MCPIVAHYYVGCKCLEAEKSSIYAVKSNDVACHIRFIFAPEPPQRHQGPSRSGL